mmetsp:Transcript_22292/g.57109  ORF Transcript_22292/g.57109 Transcript_22292/m.57109 type:complete len:86 (+) Transcript_22292:62-319(+)
MPFPPEPKTPVQRALAWVLVGGVVMWLALHDARQIEQNRRPIDSSQLQQLASTVNAARDEHVRGQALSTLRFAAGSASSGREDPK